MKNILPILLFLVFSFSGLSQSAECLFEVTLEAGQPVLVNAANVKYVSTRGAGATLVQGDRS